MHRENHTHSTTDCFELNRFKKRNKEFAATQIQERELRVPYKDLNAFMNPKVEQALKKKAREKKARKTADTDIAVNAFEGFQNLEVADSDNDDKKFTAAKYASGKNDDELDNSNDK